MKRMIQRYGDADRINHWMVALLFVLAALSGLSFFHPAFFFFGNLFGGGAWTRVLHPFIGVLVFLSFLGMVRRVGKDNAITDADRAWKAKVGELLRGNKAAMPPCGKYNWAQKMVFWISLVSLLVLFLTGFVFWRPWFAGYFPIALVRIAALLHAVAAFAMVLTTIMHVYAAIWVRGSIRAMTRGTVSEGWARQNHALWHQEMTKS